MKAVSGYQIGRQFIALALSALLIPFATGSLYAQGGYGPLDPVGLDQLVAPIALYPDALVAQILTASTYPQQVSDADNWSHQTGGMPPQQRAEIANGMPWDPSVKALTAFPSVLDNLARNYNWMSALGNAYYNQPGDVMNAIQAARWHAREAGYLRSTPQERVYDSGGLITIVPANPEVLYVPYYNPWRVYGGWVSPYAGYYVVPPPSGVALGIGIGFAAVGISLGLFSHYGWGYHHWEPNWRGGVVVYDHNTYISDSRTVANHGHFGAYNRGVFEHAGPGVPSNFRPPVTHATAGFARGESGTRPGANEFRRQAPAEARPPHAFANQAPSARPQAVQQDRVRPQFDRGPVDRGQAEHGRAERPQAQRPQFQAAPAQRPAAQPERGGNRPEAHGAPHEHAAPQGHAEHGRSDEHGHH